MSPHSFRYPHSPFGNVAKEVIPCWPAQHGQRGLCHDHHITNLPCFDFRYLILEYYRNLVFPDVDM